MQNKIATYLMYVLIAIGAALFFAAVIADQYEPFIAYSYVLSGVAIVGILAGSVFGLIHRPQAIKTIAIGVGGLAVLFAAGYGMADDSVSEAQAIEGVTSSVSQFSGAMLYMLYLMLALSIVTIIYSLVARLIK
jgi:hypothetical protein